MTKKSDNTINIATTNTPASPGMPLLNLSMTDKIYLAVARKNVDNLHYIYSLFCRENRPGNYNLMPEADIATFRDTTQADLYYNTLLQIQDYQSRGTGYRAILDFADIYIDDFRNKTR